MLDKLKEFAKQLNSLGIPLPMVRDPKTGIASVSLTLVVLSSIYVQVGLIGKYSKLLDGIDLNQAMNFFLISAGLYFGRNLSTQSVNSNQTQTNKDSTNDQQN
jgi:hypothetical protein